MRAFVGLSWGAFVVVAGGWAAEASDVASPHRHTWVPEALQTRISISEGARSETDEATFHRVIDEVGQVFEPAVRAGGGKLSLKKDWADPTVNAAARQIFGTWQLVFSGGLARHPDMTTDGFQLVVCHEMGHHLGGYPYAVMPVLNIVAEVSNEGQADYFAAFACARRLWRDQTELNSRARATVDGDAKRACDAAWALPADRDLCYRIANGGESLARVMTDLTNQERASRKPPAEPIADVRYGTPDPTVVKQTSSNHPAPQCRADTTLAAALCDASWQELLIPGKSQGKERNGLIAEREAAQVSCMKSSRFVRGIRPACWFKEQAEGAKLEPAQNRRQFE